MTVETDIAESNYDVADSWEEGDGTDDDAYQFKISELDPLPHATLNTSVNYIRKWFRILPQQICILLTKNFVYLSWTCFFIVLSSTVLDSGQMNSWIDVRNLNNQQKLQL